MTMTTDITELAQRARINAECGEHLSPAETIELVEALEKAQQHENEWKSLCEAAAVDLDDWSAIDDKSRELICKLADTVIAKAEQSAEWERKATSNFEECAKLSQRVEELESRTVTVKLPDDEDGQAYGFGKWANGKLPATAGTMTIAYCEDAWRAAFEVFSSAAGIKVEAE